MKVGDLVVVLPHARGVPFLVCMHLRPAKGYEVQQGLGTLWELYSEETGIYKMHEKWMRLISESG